MAQPYRPVHSCIRMPLFIGKRKKKLGRTLKVPLPLSMQKKTNQQLIFHYTNYDDTPTTFSSTKIWLYLKVYMLQVMLIFHAGCCDNYCDGNTNFDCNTNAQYTRITKHMLDDQLYSPLRTAYNSSNS